VAPGGTVAYTVTVTNSGQTAYTGATFTDPLTSVLGNAVYNANAAATAGTVSYASPNLTWTGNLAVGAAATITYSVTVNSPDTGSGILANTVTSTTAGSNCASGSTERPLHRHGDRVRPDHRQDRERERRSRRAARSPTRSR
jgi:hypothetical protein